jgi:hypothetical protein
MQLTQLNAKAMAVKLTMRRANLSRRDAFAEAFIQDELGDVGLTVAKKLFRDKANEVNKLMSAVSEIYTYHRRNTLPYIDKGPRILPNNNYLSYATEMRNRIATVDAMLAAMIPNYDAYVQQDIAFRTAQDQHLKSKPASYKPPCTDEYPSVLAFKEAMSFDLRFSPLPDAKHFLFDISDEDMQAFERSTEQAAALARGDAVQRMLAPLTHLAEKLSKPIGAKDSIFRDSAVENIIEGINEAKSLMLDDSPEIHATISELEKSVAHWSAHLNWMRESPIKRSEAAKKMADIASQMGAFMNQP